MNFNGLLLALYIKDILVVQIRAGVQIRFLHWGDNWSNLPKFAISRVWGMHFCKHKSILESTQVVKIFDFDSVYKTIITNIT